MPLSSFKEGDMAIRYSKFLLVVVLALLALPAAGYACRCAPPGDDMQAQVEHAMQEADAVFVGTVTHLETDAHHVVAHFEYEKCWKGECYTVGETVRTAASSATCGYHFEEGESYLVFAAGEPDDLRTHTCTLTDLLLYASKEVALLGAPQDRTVK